MKFGSFARLAVSAAWLAALAACGDGSGDDPPVADDPFDAVDAAARAAYQAEGLSGMGLAIYNHDGVKVFEQMYGTFTPDTRVPIASASKMVSGVTLFRLVDEGYLTLDSTTGQGVMEVLRARADAGAAVMLVTHEPRHAAWADRVVFLRDGRIIDQAAAMHDPTMLLTQAGL